MRGLIRLSAVLAVLLCMIAPSVFADLPATSTYKLNSYGFGSGGTANSSTSNYSLEGITGEVSGQTATTTNYSTKPGFVETQQANVPKVTISNPSNYYDKLKIVIDQQNNPSDAKYALQVKVGDATCDFTTGTIRYVKSDQTFGALTAGNISNSTTNIGVDFATNANSGGSVYIYSSNGALTSTNAPSGPITSASGDISLASKGYGGQVVSTSQLTKVSPYNQSGTTVGILSTNVNSILTSSTSIAAGTASIRLEAKPSNTTPAATDYADTLTLIAAAAF
jgi:hypothetical protein